MEHVLVRVTHTHAVADGDEPEEFAEAMKEAMKDRGDMFDDMVVHEEKIRLGETGWKARYYQVLAAALCLPPACHSRATSIW